MIKGYLMVKDKIGVYVENFCCTECDWYANPISGLHRSVTPICPKCGAETKTVVGRFTYTVAKRWFFDDDIKVTGFLKRNHEN